jgi:hypothetical protein
MKYFFLFTIISCIAFSLNIHAEKVPEKDAAKAAKNFYFERVSAYQELAYEDISLKFLKTVTYKDLQVYHVFNVRPQGFVLVSAWSETYPILGYSFEGVFTGIDLPENFTAWMEQYARQIHFAVTEQVPADHHAASAWKSYLETRPEELVPCRDRDVLPLLTSNWDQGKYYNEQCPADPAGPGGHCYAGCVATAMGQVMNYFRWPDTGLGSYSYECPPYGTLSADFGGTEYRWDLMETSLPHSNQYIARLLNHLGISVDMVYGPDGSGMYNHKAAYSLRTYFKYSPETQYVFRDSTTMDWDSLLLSHLDQKIPMYYAGWSVPNINGHAFVCDGYQGVGYYHFNWGWSASYNGYFYTNNLTPGGGNFNLAQELIIHAVPDTNAYLYPEYCSGPMEYTQLYGTIGDGSGPLYIYAGQSGCSWQIAPADSVDGLSVDFLSFDLGPNDTIMIYDGDTVSAPVLATFVSGSQPGTVDTDGSRMLVTFTSDISGEDEGFLAEFSSDLPVYCSGNTSLSSQTDTITDGSGDWDYQNNTQCIWMINPAGASEVTLFFEEFATEEGYDFVKIYDLATQEVLAELTGTYDPLPDPVTSPSGKMFIVFITNYTGRDAGWSAYYQTDLVGITEKGNRINRLLVYPNPTSGMVTLEMNGSFEGYSGLVITDYTGRKVLESNIPEKNGLMKIELNSLSSGLYFLSLEGAQAERITQKIIVR